MSLTSLVLAFAGAMAAKIKPALPAHPRIRELEEQIDRWVLLSETWEARFERLESERDALREALEREWRRRKPHPLQAFQGLHPAAQMNDAAHQAMYAQMQAQQNAFNQQNLGQQNLGQHFPPNRICNCVPARHDMFRIPGRGD